jgi:putative membrane protein insertion efficiency factor
LLRRSTLLLIRFYQCCISPLVPSRCRFYPTCSRYAEEALCRHDFARALFFIIGRLCRCHPFHHGGIDEVP